MEDYQAFLIRFLPTTCKCRVAAFETDGSFEKGMAAHLAEKCLYAQMRQQGVKPKSLGEILYFGRLYVNRTAIDVEIHDEVCGCQKPNLRDARSPRQEFFAGNIQKYQLPVKKSPWSNGDLTAWAVPAGSNNEPVIEIRFHRYGMYIGSISLKKGGQWSLYFLRDGKGSSYSPTIPFRNFEDARNAFVKEVAYA